MHSCELPGFEGPFPADQTWECPGCDREWVYIKEGRWLCWSDLFNDDYVTGDDWLRRIIRAELDSHERKWRQWDLDYMETFKKEKRLD